MPGKLLRAGEMGTGCAKFALADAERIDLDHGLAGLGRQRQPDLAPAGELDIDLGQQLGVEKSAVSNPVAPVDAIAGAQRVERMLGTGMAASREGQRVEFDIAPGRKGDEAQNVRAI